MAFFNKYPYTDFSQLNLDFILAEIRRLAEQYDSMDQIVKALQEEMDNINANIDDYVRDYFNSMTQADIEQLIASALGQSSQIVFCSSGTNVDNTGRLSLCSYIQTGDSAVIIDVGNDVAATQLINDLVAGGVTKIAAVIITHWHDDHVNGLTLQNNDQLCIIVRVPLQRAHAEADIGHFHQGSVGMILRIRKNICHCHHLSWPNYTIKSPPCQ